MTLRTVLAALLLGAVGCRGTLSPISNKLKVGEEPYVAFTADGEDGVGDLFASALSAGTAYQITFSRVDERLPALSPDGTMLAAVRSRAPGDPSAQSVFVMNLINGNERRIEGEISGMPDALAWSDDGATLYLRTSAAVLQAAAPPASGRWAPASAAEPFAVRLGDPPIAVALPCDSGGLCARLAGGIVTRLSATGTNPVRWAGDSVGYMENGEWLVRPLAGGTIRALQWSERVKAPRELSVYPGPR
ncbi:MAG: PD40 domain-containing protein [Gemmatimonadetes bacterium]|nr:PD40 domain-containing protein [Gemmatimonadota bacterium]